MVCSNLCKMLNMADTGNDLKLDQLKVYMVYKLVFVTILIYLPTYILTGNTVPSLKDLYLHITPQYAADWKVIGTSLGLPSGELKAIEAGYPTNVKWCCNQMLEK